MRVSLSAYDAQVSSIEDALDFLSCGPTEIARIGLLKRRDSNTVAYPSIRSAFQIPKQEASGEGIPRTDSIYDLDIKDRSTVDFAFRIGDCCLPVSPYR